MDVFKILKFSQLRQVYFRSIIYTDFNGQHFE